MPTGARARTTTTTARFSTESRHSSGCSSVQLGQSGRHVVRLMPRFNPVPASGVTAALGTGFFRGTVPTKERSRWRGANGFEAQRQVAMNRIPPIASCKAASVVMTFAVPCPDARQESTSRVAARLTTSTPDGAGLRPNPGYDPTPSTRSAPTPTP